MKYHAFGRDEGGMGGGGVMAFGILLEFCRDFVAGLSCCLAVLLSSFGAVAQGGFFRLKTQDPEYLGSALPRG